MTQASETIISNHKDTPWNLNTDDEYLAWRDNKLDGYLQTMNSDPVVLQNLAEPSETERAELVERCRITNMALYQTAGVKSDPDKVRSELRGFSSALGLKIAEKHRSAGSHGIVALKVTNAESQRGYIPYTTRPINWHTDGYYNGPDEQIKAMALHCVSPAVDGGVNQVLDPEIAYIRLRDENPDHIAALMHPEAMSIPENREPDGSVRPVSIGPVFRVDSDGHLIMRYTARTRSISWHSATGTTNAVAALSKLLTDGEPMVTTGKLTAGQGLLCNNVLHNRTGFDTELAEKSNRTLFRVRFFNRVSGN